MSLTKRSYVHQAFDEGYICVFPTEVVARSYLLDYALNSKKQAILCSRAISYDTFRAQFLPRHTHKHPANNLVRQLFIHQFLEAGNTLQYFLNPEYPEADVRFSTYLARLLPSLSLTLDAGLLSQLERPMVQDILLLYQSYVQFLDDHELFEPRYEQFLEPFDLDRSKKYCILFCDTIAEANELYVTLGKPSYIRLAPTPTTESWTALEVFPNHMQEIHTTLRRIRSLLENGVPAYAIGIGCASADIMIPLLSQQAKLYNIPLSVREGKSPLSYSSGRFFSLLKGVYDDQFSLESLKSLLLDLAIPFKDKDLHHAFLKAAVRASVMQGSLGAEDLYTRSVQDASLVHWYRRFKHSVIEIITSKDLEELRRKLNHFQDTYFTQEQWVGTEGEAVYAFCMDALDDIKEALRLCNLPRYSGLYSFYLSHLEQKRYVSQAVVDGIAVYQWPQVAPLVFEHLFVLALDEEGSTVVETPLSFLPQKVDRTLCKEVDTTYANFLALQLPFGTLTASCHLRSYEGQKLPPSSFLEADRLVYHNQSPNIDQDPFLAELSLFTEHRLPQHRATAAQKLWFEHALSTALLPKSEDYTRDRVPLSFCDRIFSLHQGETVLAISPTSLDLFVRCPYAYLAKYLYGVDQAEYDVPLVDHRSIGMLLHRVYQQFFSEIQCFDPSKRQAYTTQLLSLFDATLDDLYGQRGPTPSIRRYLISEYRHKILLILEQEAQLFEQGLSIEFEQEYALKQGSLLLTGRIDRVVSLDGAAHKHLAVIDYKKGSVTFKNIKKGIQSYQLLLYQALLEGIRQAKVEVACYYSIKDGKYYSLWEGADSQEALVCKEALQEQLETLVKKIENGELEATPSKDHCMECAYRALCRRRYATQ